MQCFNCSEAIDSQSDVGSSWKLVVANNIYHSSNTVSTSISYSTTFTFDRYALLAHEDVFLCAKCLNKRKKLQRIVLIVAAALFIPFLIMTVVMAGKPFDLLGEIVLFMGVIGLLVGVFGGMAFDVSEFDNGASRFVLNRYRAMGYRNAVLFSESGWEELEKKNAIRH